MNYLRFIAAGLLTAGVLSAGADTVDMTSMVQTGQSAWHGTGTYGVTVTDATGRTASLVEHYYNGDVPADEKPLYQTVAGLTPGTYHITVAATANNAWKGDSWLTQESTSTAVFYATTDSDRVTTPVTARKESGFSVAPQYSLTIAVNEGETLEIGLENLVANQTEWFTIQIISLGREATDAEALESAKSLYEAAKEKYSYVPTRYPHASQALLDIYTAVPGDDATAADYRAAMEAISSLSNLRAVILSDALCEGVSGTIDYTSSITNPNADEATTGWTLAQKDGNASIGTLSAESPTLADGTTVTNYFDGGNWGGSDWTTRFEQTVTLPKGKYRASVLARGEVDLRWLRFAAAANSADMQTIAEKGADAQVDGWFTVADATPSGGSGEATFGRGWENYSIDFEVDPAEGTTEDVTLGILARAQTEHQWHSFTYFRLVQLGSEDMTAAYNAAKTAAETALADTRYASVTGQERTALTSSIPATDPTDQAAIEAATADMQAATATFIAAAPAYDAFAEARKAFSGYTVENGCLATPAKIAALASFMVDAQSADEATTFTEAVLRAGRAVVLSNSIAEGVANRVDLTSRIVNASATIPATDNVIEGWTLAQATAATGDVYMTIKSSEKCDYGLGEDANPAYFDGETWSASGWKTRFEQKVTLPAGKYRLAVTARGSTNLDYMRLRATNWFGKSSDTTDETADGSGIDDSTYIDLNHTGNTGNVFGNGWNDCVLDFTTNGEPVVISVNAASEAGQQWHSFTNFRLTRIAEINGLEGSAQKDTYQAVCLPYAVEQLSGIKAYSVVDVTENTVYIAPVEKMEAGVPYIILPDSDGLTLPYVGSAVETPATDEFLTGVLFTEEDSTLPDNVYVLSQNKFVKGTSSDRKAPWSAYLSVPAAVKDAADELEISTDLSGRGVEGIAADDENAPVYDLQGRRVANPEKGIYIRNGKKFVVK